MLSAIISASSKMAKTITGAGVSAGHRDLE
jgi:hypothetical protein